VVSDHPLCGIVQLAISRSELSELEFHNK